MSRRFSARSDAWCHPRRCRAIHSRTIPNRSFLALLRTRLRRRLWNSAVRRRAVDPAEAERFVDRVVVRNSRLAGLLAVVHEPDLASGLVVLAQPRPPVGDPVDVQSARDLRHAIMNHTVVARASSTSDAIARPRRPTARARKSVPGTSIATLDRIPSGMP